LGRVRDGDETVTKGVVEVLGIETECVGLVVCD
jgi:hypothetical protein